MEKISTLAADTERAGRLLRVDPVDWDQVRVSLDGPMHWLSELTPTDEQAMSPYLLHQALRAVSALYNTTALHDRTATRLAVEQLRQTLRDMADEAQGAPTVDAAVLAARVVELVPQQPSEALAGLAGTSLRTWQRWVRGDATPGADQADLLRTLAQTLVHLRYAMTPAGALAWLHRSHPELDGRTPAAQLTDPVARRTGVGVAAGTRVSVAS